MIFEERWAHGGLPFLGAFGDLLLDARSNEIAAEFVREKIRQTVHDPEVARRLTPTTVIGCKRLCVDTGYYETFNRDNVELVDVSESPDRGDHATTGCGPAAGTSSWTASCSPRGSTP